MAERRFRACTCTRNAPPHRSLIKGGNANATLHCGRLILKPLSESSVSPASCSSTAGRIGFPWAEWAGPKNSSYFFTAQTCY